jgi:hypothetical protein
MALSYNKVVESTKAILTAPTGLESQSLVLTYGGADIFFARTSPSKGFDLLPESFNRILLSMVVAALMVVLVVVKVSFYRFSQTICMTAIHVSHLSSSLCLQQMGSKKIRKQGWV